MTESYNNNVEEPFVFQDNVVVVDNTPSPPTDYGWRIYIIDTAVYKKNSWKYILFKSKKYIFSTIYICRQLLKIPRFG